LREERRLRVFAKRVLRIIFGPERDEKTGEWGRGHIAEFNDLPLSPNIIWVITSKIIRWIGHVAAVGERRRVYRVLVVNPEGNRPLGRPRRR
jgi:hypothetical protein